MPGRKIILAIAFSMLLVGSLGKVGSAGQARTQSKNSSSVTEVLRVLGKGADYIVVGEQRLYVIPGISTLVNRYGTPIELRRLRIPCLVKVNYVEWVKGVDKQPVVLHLKVKKVYRGASSVESRE